MIRTINFALVLMTGLISLGVYRVAEEARITGVELRETKAAIVQEKRSMTVLGAEWARLIQPGRIQVLAERHLRLNDRPAARLASLDRLPPKFAPPPEGAIRNANVVVPQAGSGQHPMNASPAPLPSRAGT